MARCVANTYLHVRNNLLAHVLLFWLLHRSQYQRWIEPKILECLAEHDDVLHDLYTCSGPLYRSISPGYCHPEQITNANTVVPWNTMSPCIRLTVYPSSRGISKCQRDPSTLSTPPLHRRDRCLAFHPGHHD